MTDLDAIIELAQKIVAAGPKLKQLDALEKRSAELKSNVDGLSDTYRQLQSNIADKTKEHADIVNKTQDNAAYLIHTAKDDASVIITDAHNKAAAIIAESQKKISDTSEEHNQKVAELADITQKTKDAQAVYDKINAILKNMGQ